MRHLSRAPRKKVVLAVKPAVISHVAMYHITRCQDSNINMQMGNQSLRL